MNVTTRYLRIYTLNGYLFFRNSLHALYNILLIATLSPNTNNIQHTPDGHKY